MASTNEEYVFTCDKFATNFSDSFKFFLKNEELIDVKLVADGYLFSAHRLVLSAVSPYFRQMFNQMPVNQQAFVFLTDVSKHVVEELVTFIYSGEASVNQNHVEEFFKAGKALEINGLVDQSCSQAFESKSSASIWTSPAYSFNGSQYQSTRTVPFQSPANEKIYPDLAQSRHNYRQLANEFQQPSSSNLGSSLGTDQPKGNSNANNSYDNDYFDYNIENNDTTMNPHTQDIKWNNSDENEQFEAPKEFNAPKAKRMNRVNANTGFDIVADVRTNAAGVENLYQNGFKFSKHGKGLIRQHWQCTRTKSAYNCRASASTMEVDGVIMMKKLISTHTHPSIQ